MALEKNFNFSQSNLQDFVDCRRRFYWHHIKKLKWPALQSEPITEHETEMERGSAFHRLAHQYFLGVDANTLSTVEKDGLLHAWWENFLRFVNASPDLTNPDTKLYPEFLVATRIRQFRIVAKFDLLAITPDQGVFAFDWKTNHKKPRRLWLQNRMQTRIYLFVLNNTSPRFLNVSIENHHKPVRLIYWFPNYPDHPEIFSYNDRELSRNENILLDAMDLIERLALTEGYEHFPLTDEIKFCAFCNYRSLCNRGVRAGVQTEFSEDNDFSQDILLDFDQIQEIEF